MDHLIERAYEVFAGYDLPPVMAYCAHCDTAAYEKRLHRPLRSLTPDQVRDYVWDAMHHTGDERDFKHFVPRVLEEVAAGRADDAGLWLGRFAMAGFERWPDVERAAVTDVLLALWEAELAAYPGPYGVEELLCGLGSALGDLGPVLDAWAARDDEPALRHLDELAAGTLDDAFWADEPRAQAEAWLRAVARPTT